MYLVGTVDDGELLMWSGVLHGELAGAAGELEAARTRYPHRDWRVYSVEVAR